MQGKCILGLHRTDYGIFRGGEGMDLGDLGRKKHGKNRGIRG